MKLMFPFRMKTTLVLILTSSILSSCATLFNARTDVMRIVTNEPGKIIVNEDTLRKLSTEHFVLLKRSKESIPVSVYNAEKSKSFNVKARNSFAYWCNIYPTYGLGFLVDMNNPKRYSYPRTIYVDMDQQGNHYTTYLPLDSSYTRYGNVLKLNPMKAIGFINSGLEISLEKRLSKSFTTQLSGTYLFQNSVMDPNWDLDNETKGFQAGIEPRYYLRKTAPAGPYIGLEFSYLKSRYKDIWLFGNEHAYRDSSYINYADTFGVHKQTYTLNFKLGYQIIRKRLTIDLYTGFGVRYKEVSHFDRIKPEDPMEMPRHPNIYYIMNKEGKYFTGNFPLNFRIGWTF